MGNKHSAFECKRITNDMHPLKLRVEVLYPDKKPPFVFESKFTHNDSLLSKHDEEFLVPVDVDATYTYTVKVHVARYIKEANWCLVLTDQTPTSLPLPIEGRVPRSKFPPNARVIETKLPLSAVRKDSVKYTFQPIRFGEKLQVGQRQSMWVYTYDEQGIVHHYHCLWREVANVSAAELSRLMNLSARKLSEDLKRRSLTSSESKFLSGNLENLLHPHSTTTHESLRSPHSAPATITEEKTSDSSSNEIDFSPKHKQPIITRDVKPNMEAMLWLAVQVEAAIIVLLLGMCFWQRSMIV
eukprot:comp18103_c0_seq1/m.18753 comp18103_c0_seq1/g.18753  ORF comp18103_c0_seq1/g.18753 comp18103_c0_seq1/m.18753 type:complete len:298 (-) comp18103_c0_seq1:10-903(-)